jgi:gliding motility-associated-like protein
MEDPNRNNGIINVPRSVEVPFYIQSTLTINPFLAGNNSPILTNPPIDIGCTNVPFYHNPGAVDPDGDSLVYSLIHCRGLNGEFIPGYAFPNAFNSISINPNTGDFYWDYPTMQGEYNIAILIEEYRLGVKVGEVIRDMQINIGVCNNEPPKIIAIEDTCINAGDLLTFRVTATDSPSQIVAIEASGDVFYATGNKAVFVDTARYGNASGTFYWQTGCNHVRKQPFQATFKAYDNHPTISLTSLKTVRITVVAPPPENLQAVPFQNTITLTWDTAPCTINLAGYKIYRRMGSSGFVPDHCETGVPAYTGYQQIGRTDIHTTSFVDNNNGAGLLHGNEYCYLVIAFYHDNAESYASDEVCAFLKKDVPIITHVSILETDHSNGKVEIKWVKPHDFIDTIPYSYTVGRSINGNAQPTNVATVFSLADTVSFIDSMQNTVMNTFYYQINLYDNTTTPFLIGSSDAASSVYLSIDSSDEKLILSWKSNTPWKNYKHIIYRQNGNSFDSIGETNTYMYADTALINDQLYCYYVETVGEYADATLPKPLKNLSQTVCARPVDNVPPCVAILKGETDCKDIRMQWSFPDSCNLSDIAMIYIYYRNDISSDYLLLDSISTYGNNYDIIDPPSIAGCFFLVLTDAKGNKSSPSNELCFDTDICDSYKLPNVFTPNGDGKYDYFRPFPYDYVESVDVVIFNKWGMPVFETNNPDIMWDGTNQFTKQPCVDGVYYYVCKVNEYTLNGIRTRFLNGSVTIFR